MDRNPDLHFVTSSNWRSLEWPDPEVFAKLEELNQQSRQPDHPHDCFRDERYVHN